MSYAFVASSAPVGAASGVTTAAIDTTGANLICVAVICYSVNPATLSDSKGNTWTGLGTTTSSAVEKIQIFYKESPTVGAGHTFTLSGGSSFSTVVAFAFSGGTSASFDKESGNTTTSALTMHLASTSFTPSNANSLIFAAVSAEDSGHYTTAIDSGFTGLQTIAANGATHNGLTAGYLIQTTASALDPIATFNATDSSPLSRVAVFKSAAPTLPTLSGVTYTPGTLTSSGFGIRVTAS